KSGAQFMKRSIVVVWALLVCGAGVAAAAPPAKIAFVDLQRLRETKAGKEATAKLESEKNEKQKQVNLKKEALQKAKEELDKQRVVLKPDVVAKKEQELQDQYVDLQQTFVQLQQELSKREAQLLQDMFGRASPIIDAIAKRDGYTMVLDKAAVLWADKETDITPELMRRMDAGEGG